MKSVDVLYLVEHASRELDIACAVKHRCEEKYHLRVEVIPLYYSLDKNLHTYRPDMIVTPYLLSRNDSILDRIIRWYEKVKRGDRTPYLNLNFEQYLSDVNRQFRRPRDAFAKQQAVHYAWGEAFQDYLSKSGVDPRNITVGGNPGFILYRKPYRDYFPGRDVLAEKYKLDAKKKWIFFPENYYWAFLADDEIIGRIQRGYPQNIAFETREFSSRSLDAVIDWIAFLSKRNDVEFILRPRPAVSTGEYMNRINRRMDRIPEHLKIIKGETVREWNLACNVVCSSISTTLLESIIAGKPAFIIEPLEFPEWLRSDWMDRLPHVRTPEEFAAMADAVRMDPKTEEFKGVLEHEYLDGRDPIDNVAALIARIIEQNRVRRGFDIRRTAGRWVDDIYYGVRKTFFVNDVTRLTKRYENDRFIQTDVDGRIRRWKRVLNPG